MRDVKPVRLQLSRKAGFNLQEHSLSINGLPALKVTRPGPWGNPFSVLPQHAPGSTWSGGLYIAVPTPEDAVKCFAEMMACADTEPGTRSFELRRRLHELRGKNLACWCKPGAPCHADVLLALATTLDRSDA